MDTIRDVKFLDACLNSALEGGYFGGSGREAGRPAVGGTAPSFCFPGDGADGVAGLGDATLEGFVNLDAEATVLAAAGLEFTVFGVASRLSALVDSLTPGVLVAAAFFTVVRAVVLVEALRVVLAVDTGGELDLSTASVVSTRFFFDKFADPVAVACVLSFTLEGLPASSLTVKIFLALGFEGVVAYPKRWCAYEKEPVVDDVTSPALTQKEHRTGTRTAKLERNIFGE